MRLRIRHVLLIDLLSVVLAAVGAFVIRYEALWRVGPYIVYNAYFFITLLVVRPVVYYLFGLYHCWWRYASVAELLRIVKAVAVGSIVVAALIILVIAPNIDGGRAFSGAVLLLEGLLNMVAIGSTRILLRLLQRSGVRRIQVNQYAPVRRVLIMGAGDAGALILREMRNNPDLGYAPVGFVDDDSLKRDAEIHGVKVLGTRHDIPHLVAEKQIDEVIIAMPTASGAVIREVRALCATAQVATKTIPGLYELLNGSVSVKQIRAVKIEDLLRREPVQTDLAAVEGFIRGAVVLVTGAGGSIGSELCRQIVARRPQRLLLLGHGENSIFNILNELHRLAPAVELVPLIADVRDGERIARLLRKHRPTVVFDAAAHKHVPLMESNPEEAFTTNALGTENVLRAAEQAGVARFVLISSDKAVNPANIMGASKRLAELLVQRAAQRSGQRYVAVRFGNVLGSRGSVVPLFEQQIAAGGPVTVTHPDMVRYFMTIPEAVQLVLQAAALGQGGEVFVLNMGEQIRILDLARDLISLSGLTPGKDIEIVFTGVRPGEKLYEELFGANEAHLPTSHDKVWQSQSAAPLAEVELAEGIALVLEAARGEDTVALYDALRRLLPSFCAADELTPLAALVPEAALLGAMAAK